MPLESQQIKIIASLKDNPAFNLLLDSIQAHIDDAMEVLYQSDTKEIDIRALEKWRALKQVHAILKTTPEEFYKEQERENPDKLEDDVNETITPQGEYWTRLIQQYQGQVQALSQENSDLRRKDYYKEYNKPFKEDDII